MLFPSLRCHACGITAACCCDPPGFDPHRPSIDVPEPLSTLLDINDGKICNVSSSDFTCREGYDIFLKSLRRLFAHALVLNRSMIYKVYYNFRNTSSSSYIRRIRLDFDVEFNKQINMSTLLICAGVIQISTVRLKRIRKSKRLKRSSFA